MPPSTSLNLELSRRCISVTSEKLACVAGEKRGAGGERRGRNARKRGKGKGALPLSPHSPSLFPFLPIPVLTPATQDSEKHAKQLESITS